MTAEVQRPPVNGLRTLGAIVLAPAEGFAELRERPTWVWALAFAVAFGMIGAYLMTPASSHVLEHILPAQLQQNPQVAAMAPDKQADFIARQTAFALGFAKFGFLALVVTVPIAVLVKTVTLLAGKAIAKGTADFRHLWAVSASTVFIGTGVNALVLGIIVALRSPASFTSQTDILSAMPTLAWFAPSAPAKLTAFLSTITPFTLWSTALLALGLTVVARMSRVASWSTAAVVLVGGGAIAAAFVK